MKRLLNVTLLILAIFIGSIVGINNNKVFADKSEDDKTSVSIEVNWIGEELLASVEVDLFANDKLINTATITSDADWKYVFENLPKYNDEGNLINYTVVQKRTGMEYYLKSRVSGNMEEGFVITNFQVKSVHIIKLWNISHPGEPSPMSLNPDKLENNLNGKLEVVNGVREDVPVDAYGNPIDSPVSKVPMPKSITVNLLADGKIVATKVITEEDNWECNFENMPKYDEKDGHEIKYEVKEEPVKGYKATYHYLYFGNFIINKSVVDVSVEKKWVGTPKDEAEVTLYRDYEVSEYDVLTETFKKSVKTEAVETIKLNKDNNWKHTFKELQEMYMEFVSMSKYKYYVKEKEIDGYKSVITGDEDKGFTITNIDTSKMSIPVQKIWKGVPVEKVKIVLKADGVEKEVAELNYDNEWMYTFENLDRVNPDNSVIKYTVEEEEIKGYKSFIKQRDAEDISKGVDITNYQYFNLKISKYWNILPYLEAVPQKEHGFVRRKIENPLMMELYSKEKSLVKLPESITIHLYADGKLLYTKVLTKEDNWAYVFNNIPMFDEKDGHLIKYEIKEDPIPGYKTIIGSDYVVNMSLIDIPVEKKWLGNPKDEVEISLYRDYDVKEYNLETGEEIVTPKTDLVTTIKLNKANNWKYTFKDLEEFYADKISSSKYKYYIKETSIEGYETEIKQNDENDIRKGIVITNRENSIPNPKPKPGSKIPKTGIDANIIMSLGLMTASGMGLGIYVKKKRK